MKRPAPRWTSPTRPECPRSRHRPIPSRHPQFPAQRRSQQTPAKADDRTKDSPVSPGSPTPPRSWSAAGVTWNELSCPYPTPSTSIHFNGNSSLFLQPASLKPTGSHPFPTGLHPPARPPAPHTPASPIWSLWSPPHSPTRQAGSHLAYTCAESTFEVSPCGPTPPPHGWAFESARGGPRAKGTCRRLAPNPGDAPEWAEGVWGGGGLGRPTSSAAACGPRPDAAPSLRL